jgi:NitT/TauT family transport system permease protein
MKRLINQTPTPVTRTLFGLLPFILLVIVYLLASDARLAENPGDKMLPSAITIRERRRRGMPDLSIVRGRWAAVGSIANTSGRLGASSTTIIGL